jgi:hypothetical protein
MTGSAKVSEKATSRAAFNVNWIDFFGTTKKSNTRCSLKEIRGKDKHVERVSSK